MNVATKAAATGGTNILTGRGVASRITVQGDAGQFVDFYDFAGDDGATPQVNLAAGYNYKTHAEGDRASNGVTDYTGESLDYTYHGLLESSATRASGNVALPKLFRVATGQDIPVTLSFAKGLFIKSTAGTPTVIVEYTPLLTIP